MPRPCKQRRCRPHRGDRVFKPRSIPMPSLEVVGLALSELEAMRLCDHEGLDQSAAGRRMGVSRGTVQRLLKAGRSKLMDVLLHQKALRIEPGESHEDLYSESGRAWSGQ